MQRGLTNVTEVFDHSCLEQNLPHAVGYGHTERCMLLFTGVHLDACSSSLLLHMGPSMSTVSATDTSLARLAT